MIVKCSCFLGADAPLGIIDDLRCSLARFNLGAHFLDKRFLLLQFCFESVNCLLLPLHGAVLFQKLVEQYRVHQVVTNGVNLAVEVGFAIDAA